jgi:hypothetical protein
MDHVRMSCRCVLFGIIPEMGMELGTHHLLLMMHQLGEDFISQAEKQFI